MILGYWIFISGAMDIYQVGYEYTSNVTVARLLTCEIFSCGLATPESTWTPRASSGTHRSALLAFLLDGLLRHSSCMPVAHKHRGVHWQTVSLLRHCTPQPVAVTLSLKKQNQSTGLCPMDICRVNDILLFSYKQVLILTPDVLLISKDQDQTGQIFDEILLRSVAESRE